MRNGSPTVRFDQILTRVDRRLQLDDGAEYNCVGVRWYGQGAFLRERRAGYEIKRKQQWIIKSGDVVYNKLFAWKGAFAVADSAVDACIVSDKFPTYAVDPDRVEPHYLAHYFRMPGLARQAQELSKGAAAISKLTLNPPQFWDLTIPLPPLAEQRRIVAKIDQLAAKIAEARGLRGAASDAGNAVLPAALLRAAESLTPLGELRHVLGGSPRNGWSARCDNADGGNAILSLSAVTGYRYNSAGFKRTSLPTVAGAHYWLRPGDLLITRSNTPDLVGHAAIYDGSPAPCIYPDLMMRLDVDERKADARFVWYWLQSPPARSHIAASATGTSPTMKKISQGTVMRIPYPARLTLSEQRRIVAYLDDLQAKVDRLKALQDQTAAELDALLPAVLDKAFKGEL